MIYSPLAGTVITVDRKIGETTSGMDRVMMIADLSALNLAVDVDETDIGQVQLGQPALFTLNAFPNEEFFGTVGQIAERAVKDSNNDTVFRVKIYPQTESQKRWRLGMEGNVRIIRQMAKEALAIPIESLQTKDGQDFVYTVNAGYVKKVLVETGIKNEYEVEIKKGLNEGERVVTGDFEKIKEGAKVKGF